MERSIDKSKEIRAGSVTDQQKGKPSLDMLLKVDTAADIRKEIVEHDWNEELDGRIQLFYSGDGRPKNEREGSRSPDWQTKRSDALVSMAREIDPRVQKPQNQQEFQAIEDLCARHPEKCRQIMIDQTQLGQRIEKAFRRGDINEGEKRALFKEASPYYASAANTNYLKYNIHSFGFVDKADADWTFAKREHPWLESIVTDERSFPWKNRYERLSNGPTSTEDTHLLH